MVQPTKPEVLEVPPQRLLYHIVVIIAEVRGQAILEKLDQVGHPHLKESLSVELQYAVGHGKHDDVPLQQEQVPNAN